MEFLSFNASKYYEGCGATCALGAFNVEAWRVRDAMGVKWLLSHHLIERSRAGELHPSIQWLEAIS
jgi:hypothetical protein